ncbi:MAG: hypothetical protein ACSLFK_16050 [Gemmatimonadaceae bacterium]
MTVRLFCVVLAGLAIAACKGDESPKTPLGAQMGAEQSPVSPIGGAAKLALDSGNLLFRAKAYALALEQYRRSADLAPSEIAPLLGIMMVAEVTKDSELAEATRPRIRKLNPAVADSSAAMSHSKIIEAHPPVTTTLPSS